MSFFNQTSSAPSSGGSSLFPALNLSTPTVDQSGRKRSIFDSASSTRESQSTIPTLSLNLGGITTTSVSSGPSTMATATSAPFGFGLTTSTSAPATNSIFGTTPSAPTQSSNLFGGLGGATSQSTVGPTTLNTGPTTSIFGAPQPTLNQPSQSIQQPDPLQQRQARETAHFSSLLERQKKKTKVGKPEQNGRLSQMPSLNMDLGDLARRAQEIGGHPSRTENLAGLDSRAHYLLAASGVSPGKAYRDFQAVEDEGLDDFRPSKEPIDPASGNYIRDLEKKGREAIMRESMDRVYREVDTFIQDSLGIDFEEQKQRIMAHFGLVPKDDNLPHDPARPSPGPRGSQGASAWKGKNPFAESAKGSTRSVFGRSAMDRSLIGTPGMTGSTTSFFGDESNSAALGALSRGQTARDLRDKERLYVESVEKLNRARLEDRNFPVMQHFAEVEESTEGDSPRQLADAYRALQEITHEHVRERTQAESGSIKERQYAKVYLDEHVSSSKAMKLKKQIIDGSRTYLEKSFFRELEILVEKNPREAQLGGRPTVINKVRAYIRVRSARRDLAPDGAELQQIGDDGDFCWIIIFYLLRSGHVKDAVEYVTNDPAFQSTDKRFISYLTSYGNSSDHRLSRKLQEMINGEYSQRSKIASQHSVDPYRMACYKIVGRCDLSSRNLDAVGQGVEDWIWLQFSLARELDRQEEISGEVFGLEQICDTVNEIGQKHFQKGRSEANPGGYGTYFLMQILAGMFEPAVDYLHSYNPVSAVHFGIALAYYGLLRVSDYSLAGNELLTYSTTQKPQLNFVPLIAYYTAAFRTALPAAAVDYLSLICLNSDLTPPALGAAQTAACHECLRQLCLETREFAKLLGDIYSDGTRIPGVIEMKAKLINVDSHEDFLSAVTTQAAGIANERGQVADAVLLYHLSEDYDNVVSILNRALADAVTIDLGESPMQLQPLKPRRRLDQNSPNGSRTSQSDGPQSSLSLTQSTSSPVELAKNMISLYNGNAAYYNLISGPNRDTCGALLQLLSARALLESTPPRFMAALETLNELNILPLRANGSIPTIRAAASAFGSLPQILARCAGVSVVWAVRAIGGERDNIMKHGSWDAGSRGDRDVTKDQLNSMAKDLMVFAGLVKYKLPGRVYDLLTRAGGDVGVY